jgi:hypothetical protein
MGRRTGQSRCHTCFRWPRDTGSACGRTRVLGRHGNGHRPSAFTNQRRRPRLGRASTPMFRRPAPKCAVPGRGAATRTGPSNPPNGGCRLPRCDRQSPGDARHEPTAPQSPGYGVARKSLLANGTQREEGGPVARVAYSAGFRGFRDPFGENAGTFRSKKRSCAVFFVRS